MRPRSGSTLIRVSGRRVRVDSNELFVSDSLYRVSPIGGGVLALCVAPWHRSKKVSGSVLDRSGRMRGSESDLRAHQWLNAQPQKYF